MDPLRNSADKARAHLGDLERFLRQYTSGLRARDVRLLFGQEAVSAYELLARDQAAEPEPQGQLQRFFRQAKVLFLGLSYRLTPVRRVLFVACLLAALIGLIPVEARVTPAPLFIDFSPFWFLVSIAGLVFLLTLELVDRVRVRDELEVARQLQSDLLPSETPEVPGWRIAHAYRTANEVGGDYYDFHQLLDGRLAIMVGDASGHGIAAGLLMAIANASLKLALELDPSPQAVMRLLNKVLCGTGDRRSFMSLFYGCLDVESGELTYSSAGHPYPLVRCAGGAIHELGQEGLPLGIRPDLEFNLGSTVLGQADLLLLYTDGLPEAVDREESDSFGYERLKELLRPGGTPRAVHDRILFAFDDFTGGDRLRDDFSLVVLGRL